jgi:branched-chain amino acid transport system substrate-binding protein
MSPRRRHPDRQGQPPGRDHGDALQAHRRVRPADAQGRPDPQFSTLSPIGADLLVAEMGAKEAHGIGISQVMPYPWNDTAPVVKEYHKAVQAYRQTRQLQLLRHRRLHQRQADGRGAEEPARIPPARSLSAPWKAATSTWADTKVGYSPTSHNGSRFVDLTVLGGTDASCADTARTLK